MNHADPDVASCDRVEQRTRPVGRAVVHDDELGPVDTIEDMRASLGDGGLDRPFLVVYRHHDAQRRTDGAAFRVVGPRRSDIIGGMRRLPVPTLAAIGIVLAWFGVQLARFLGDPPDLDAMITLRESLVVRHLGLEGLAAVSNRSIHPPLLDALSSLMFAVFGDEPRSPRLLSIALFAVVAASVERLLVPWVTTGQRILSALAVATCPALAVALFLVSREGMMVAVLAAAIAFAVRCPARPVALGTILAILPLIKETGIVFAVPFAVVAATDGEHPLRRAACVLAPPIAAAALWQAALVAMDARAWTLWIHSAHADEGPYAVALRAMLGLEPKLFLAQNLVNGLVVNFLWLPAILSIATIVMLVRSEAPRGLPRAAALVGGLALIYAWSTLTFPTYTIPRYAVPLTLCVLIAALLGLPLWPTRARPLILGGLLIVFALGSWTPADPVSRAFFGVTTVAGQPVYDTAEIQRGPDRIVLNFGVLRATRGMNARLQEIYRSPASLVTGDCNALKLGEKLYSVGLHPDAYAAAFPGARALRCVAPDELPRDAGRGADTIALVRLPEDEGKPPPLAGPSVLTIR